ncbi:MAG: 3-keto-5-aminohexanoate cleavage protein [Desulfobacteraceae bacterium]|nr:MAG: 3-keto-5-aminohexanoate cleavage protein [Desulfobacteraceae bacterium]
MENEKVVITVAVTGGIGDKSRHPQLPVSPKEIADSAMEAYAAGAAVAHIHVRNPETAEPSMSLEYYREVVERIREKVDMIINLTTGAGARIVPDDSEVVRLDVGTTWRSPEKRVEHAVKLRPELCSLDVGSMNFGPRVFANILPHVEKMALLIREAGVKPELEVFDMGHMEIAKHLIRKGLVQPPAIFQLCLGIDWGIAASPKSMMIMKDALPQDALWCGFGVGPTSFPMAAQAVLLGGNIRVGFEDNFYISPGKEAKTNSELVEKAVRILHALDRKPATSDEARRILHLV